MYIHRTKASSLQRMRQRGLTLIEALCAASVLATTLGLAIPGMQSWRNKQALLAEAAELETAVNHARSAAVAMGRPVRLETYGTTLGTCYVVHTGPANACQCTGLGNAICSGDTDVLRVNDQSAGAAVQLITNSPSMAFDPQRGTVTPTATFRFIDAQGRSLHQIVNVMARVRSCSPQGIELGVKRC